MKYLYLFIVCTVLGACKLASQKPASPYKNVNSTANYVGMNTCKGCHADIYNTFIETGMGKSFDKATKTKSSATFNSHSLIFDTINNLYYFPFWQKDTLYIKEFRLENKDTTHIRIEKVDYIIGSGQHTNSHLIFKNGFLYQAPITYYTQKGKWDLAPGFEKGSNSKFSRIVGKECITCHNFYPNNDLTAENKYNTIPKGIACERCHGPGSIHVTEKTNGILVDVATQIDYSIVNPAKLSRELQIDVCQRCHLQGVTVLEKDKSYFDFEPGTPLSNTLHGFIPRYTDSASNFIMASHADRMKQSKCFKKSDMTCLNCHNPHVSVKATPIEKFVNACTKCHFNNNGCKLPIDQQKTNQNNCVSCHMPISGSSDIPHVAIHDHRIHKPNIISKARQNEVRKFVRLACVTTKQPQPNIIAEAYLNYFEAYIPIPQLLDTAQIYINQLNNKESIDYFQLYLRYLYLKNDYKAMVELAASTTFKLANINSWTCYRIGEALLSVQSFEQAKQHFEAAVKQQPNESKFIEKYAVACSKLLQWPLAIINFKKAINLNVDDASAYNNLGYCYWQQNNQSAALANYTKALNLQPDYLPVLFNLIAFYAANESTSKVNYYILRVQKIDPNNKQLIAIKKTISKGL